MTAAQQRRATAHLAACDPDWALLIDLVGPCRLHPDTTREPWVALIHSVAHQQIHGRAAQAILKRFLALYPGHDFPSPAALLATDEAALRACGFSASKFATLRGIAEQAERGVIPTREEANGMSDEALVERLVTLRGVGRWTVDMLLMHTLGRPDILPIGDFGVREGWRLIKGLEKQPTPKQLEEIGRPWAPWRSFAAWYLWRAVDQYRLTQPRPGQQQAFGS